MPTRNATEQQRGFALLIVLWTLVLIAFLVGRLASAGSTEIRIAGNLAANASAQAAADGAIYQAIFQLSDPRPQNRWALDGQPRELHIGQSDVTLRLENEAARVNPNFASTVLVEALLQVLGVDPEQAARLAAAIAEWVGKPTVSAPLPSLAEYQMTVPDYRPPRAPIASIDELAQVRGMTPPILAALRPHLTLLAPGDPDPATTDPVVEAALALAARLTSPIGEPQASLSTVATVRIEAVANGPANARLARTAVVRIDAVMANGYAVLATDDSEN